MQGGLGGCALPLPWLLPSPLLLLLPGLYLLACARALVPWRGPVACECHQPSLCHARCPAAVAPHVPRLLRALLTCFKDASWPVSAALRGPRTRRSGPLSRPPLPRPTPPTH